MMWKKPKPASFWVANMQVWFCIFLSLWCWAYEGVAAGLGWTVATVACIWAHGAEELLDRKDKLLQAQRDYIAFLRAHFDPEKR